jgi:hypothetical protein
MTRHCSDFSLELAIEVHEDLVPRSDTLINAARVLSQGAAGSRGVSSQAGILEHRPRTPQYYVCQLDR